MPIDLKPIHCCEDLGNAWIREHTARIQLKHLQFDRHFRLDVDSLLSRAALVSRAVTLRRRSRANFMQRATVDAIEHCFRLDAASSTAAMKPNAR